MKYLKSIDFAGQTIIIGGYAIVAGTWIMSWHKNSLGLTTAFAMLCLGWWQMISAILLLLLNAPNKKLRQVHFYTAIGYLFLVGIGSKYLEEETTQTLLCDTIQAFSMFLFYATPVILALLYYYLTWRWVFPTKPSGKFLPHISF